MAVSSSSTEPTLRGRVLLSLAGLTAGAAWLGDDPNARLAAALLATPVVVDFVARQRRFHCTSIQVLPRQTVAGAVYTESLVVEHGGLLPLHDCLLIEPRTMRQEPPVLLPMLLPHQRVRIEVTQRSPLRGHALERVFLIESGWPLGMFRTRSAVVVRTSLVTEPARVALPHHVEAAIEAELATSDHSRLPGPEFVALREHRLDEDARGVHALRSAALGTLVRRITSGQTPLKGLVVLDLRRPHRRGRSRGRRRFEWGLGACATLAERLLAHGARIQILVLAGEPVALELSDPAHLPPLLMLLAEASPAAPAPVPRSMLEQIRGAGHCFWIAAGGHEPPAEAALAHQTMTMVQEVEA